MNLLPPIQNDRIISRLPQCFRREAALHRRENFNDKVKTACQEQPSGRLAYKISKVIVVGDLAVGKTCLINRFCKDVFDRNYNATLGVDFEIENFQVLGVPFTLQLWDTSGQERYKCIASSYYRGAQVVIVAFDVNDIGSFSHVRQWLEESLEDNDVAAIQLFLVGTKKDLSSPAQYSQMERDALKLAREIGAEYWAVSSLTGENVNEFFSRVASLGFENSILAELEEKGSATQMGEVPISSHLLYIPSKKEKKCSCCQ
ncbi:ras-related protein Rab-34-like [Takifugu flavidus]|uniref:Ras-related protein Rab-36 n=1 Tax=Takifugu flavidus TaxID=433684 RepID=A0A5C6NSE1_9TELE|nr:ras-related protein Rab-34-like [Takifugu flavidus]TWW69875.1 Ras-related protein [Takifugu flavidus]